MERLIENNIHLFPCLFHGIDKVGSKIIEVYDGKSTSPTRGGSLKNIVDSMNGKKFDCLLSEMTPLPDVCEPVGQIFETDRNDTKYLNILASGNLELIHKTNIAQGHSDGSRWIEPVNGFYRLYYYQESFNLDLVQTETLRKIVIALQAWYAPMWQRIRSNPGVQFGTSQAMVSSFGYMALIF